MVWVGQRECARCLFAGPETEFIALGSDLLGDMIITHRDAAPVGSVDICIGCSVDIGRMSPEVLSDAVRNMLTAAS